MNVDHLTDEQKTAVAANLANILKWEQTLAQSNDKSVHRQTADLLRQLKQMLEPATKKKTAVVEHKDNEKVKGTGKRKKRGYVEIKTINGRPYAYRRWREGGRLRSEYVGKVK